jgi:aryl carrier-like protein
MPFGRGVELALVAFCVFADNNNNSSSSTAEEMQLPHIQEASPFASHVTSLIDQLRSLPHYMLPKYVFPANSFPKLPSLKTDRKTLKRWLAELDKAVLPSYSVAGAQRGSEAEAVYAPVETEDEMALEGMWKAILQMPDDAQVGRAANFGALGGDSIAAIRLVVLARAQGYALSVAKLLKCATLQEMTLTMTKMAAESVHGVPVKEYQASSAVLSAVADAGLDMEADVDYSKSAFLFYFSILLLYMEIPLTLRPSLPLPARPGRVPQPGQPPRASLGPHGRPSDGSHLA